MIGKPSISVCVIGQGILLRTLTEEIHKILASLPHEGSCEGKSLIVILGDREESVEDSLEMLLRFKDNLNLNRFVLSEIIDNNPASKKQIGPGFLSKVFPIREEICLSCDIKIFLVKRNKGPPAPCFFLF